MLAVKAKYDNGVVRWLDEPPIKGFHDLIILFEDVADRVGNADTLSPQSSQEVGGIQGLPPLPELDGAMPQGWKEAIYGE